jgi:hypothetical protein
MRFVGLDLEFTVDTRALVCVSLATRIAEGTDRSACFHTTVLAAHDPLCRETLLRLLRDPTIVIVGMAWALDSVVLCAWGGEEIRQAIVEANAAGRVCDVFQREWLWWVAFPGFVSLWQEGTKWDYIPPDSEDRHGAGDDKRPNMSLAGIVDRWTGRNIEKSKSGQASVRLSFGRVAGLSVSLWPDRYREYAIDDAIDHLLAWEAQGAGVSGNVCVNSETLEGLGRLWGRVRAAIGTGVPECERRPWQLPGERKAVMDALCMAWLCEPKNGGLYCDPVYCDRLIDLYRGVAIAVEPTNRPIQRSELSITYQRYQTSKGQQRATQARQCLGYG